MFHVFAGADYYAEGGADDYVASYPTLNAATDAIKQIQPEDDYGYTVGWAHVTDAEHNILARFVYGRPSRSGWKEAGESYDEIEKWWRPAPEHR